MVELDRPADAPVDLFVNGVRFAQGHLLVTDDGEWALVSTIRVAARCHRTARASRSPPLAPQPFADAPDSISTPESDPTRRSTELMARVLVVDDAAFMRKVVSDALASGGHEVIGEAGNGTEAIARFQELHPELTTLDITMPEKDGLSRPRGDHAIDPGARVLMCSALGQETKVIESIKLGAKDFVVKPFQPERLLEAVGKALS